MIENYLSGGAGIELVSGLLFALGAMLLVVDALGPGLGVSGFIGTGCLTACFLPDAIAGSVSWGLVALAGVGCALLLLDSRFAGLGPLGWLGIGLLVVTLGVAAVNARQFLYTLCAAVVLITIAMPVTLARLPRSRLMNRIQLNETLESSGVQADCALPAVGSEGIACGDLRPRGWVEIEGERHEACAAFYIEKGACVRVTRCEGRILYVERAEP